MRRTLSLAVVALFLIALLQPVWALPAKAQPFTSPGTRYGMNVETCSGVEDAFVDIMHHANYPYPPAGGTIWFFAEGDPPGLQTYNFYGEGIFTPAFTGYYSTNQAWPYGGVWNLVGMRGAVQSTVSILPPNYPGNPTNQRIILLPNTPGDPAAVPPVPPNPFPIAMVIPPNSPPNSKNVVVTTCQVQYQIPPQSPSGWVYSPQNGVQGIPLSWITIYNCNPQNQPGENCANFHFTRPGYPAWTANDSDYPVTATSYPLFTQAFLKSFAPFCCLRFMDWMNTNGNTGLSWGANSTLVNSGPYDWSNRQKQGVPGDWSCYEYMIALCNATNCDMWFNVPLQATVAWKQGFANLVVNNLHPWLHVYHEHGNELWNWGFIAWQLVNQWAIADGFGGGWFGHGKEMGKLLMDDINVMGPIFQQMGPDFARPIAAGQFVDATDYCGGMLSYIQSTYGPPKNYIYGMAGAPYFGTDPNEFNAADLTAMQANMKIANQYGIKMCSYEGGLGTPAITSPNDTADLALEESSATANQYYLFAQMWQQNGGDLCNWFTNCGLWGKYGCWGHLPVGSYINNLGDPACTRYDAAATISSVCNCGNAAPPATSPTNPSSGGSGSNSGSNLGSGSNSSSNGSTGGTGSNSSSQPTNNAGSNNLSGAHNNMNSPGGVPRQGGGGGGGGGSSPGGVPWMQ